MASTLTGKLKDLVDIQEKIIGSSPDELMSGKTLPSSFQGGVTGILAQIQGCEHVENYAHGSIV
jgi:hypothetical protein